MTAPTTTTASDPFAAVQVPAAQAAPATAGTPVTDPFTPAVDKDDPFATNSDFRGDFTPSPTLEVLQGRLVVMIPRSLDPEAKDPNNPGKTREVFTVDLTVLDGGPLEYTFKRKADPEKGTPETWEKYDAGNVTPDSPFTVEGFWVPQGVLIGKLKKAHASGAPFLGVVSMGPTKDQRDRGVTAAQVREAYASWVAAGKPGNSPKFAWSLEDPDATRRAAAVAWWGRVRSTIKPITAVQYSR